MPTIVRLINICWYFFKLGAGLVVVAAVALGVFLFTRMDDEIRRHVETTLAQHFPHLNVNVGGARLVEGRGIAVYDLSLAETSSTNLQKNLLVIDELVLECDVQLVKLVRGTPPIKRVIVKHPQLYISRQADGKWNVGSLWPPPQCSDDRPQVVIEDAQVALADEGQATLAPLVLRDVNLTISGAREIPGERSIRAHCTLSGPNVKRAEFKAQLDPAGQSLEVAGELRQLQLSSELLAWVSCYGKGCVGPAALQGNVDGSFTVKHQWSTPTPPQIDARLSLTAGRIDDPRLPRPLTDVTAQAVCQGQSLRIDELRANCGSATVALTAQRAGWSASSPLAAAVRIENLPLDTQLFQALPPFVQEQWTKYQPTGLVDAEAQVTCDGTRWLPVATLTGRDLAFESDKFPYRVGGGSGTLRYRVGAVGEPTTLDIELTAIGGGQPLKIVGQVLDPAPGAVGWIEIAGQNIAIEQRMIAALPDSTRPVIQSLNPEGRFNVFWRMDRTQLGQAKLRKSLQLELVDARVNYDKFPYPLRGIRGLVIAEDDNWSFQDLVSGGARSVRCQGYLQPTSQGKELSLQFTAQEIPLDGELKEAVPDGVSRAWDELHPRGQIDLTADVYHVTGLAKPTIRVAVRPRPETASIEPRFFPYLMEKVEGTINYNQGELLLTDMRAEHSRTTIRTNGSGRFAADGSWHVQLEGLSADRLTARRELVGALPPKLQKIIDQLKPSGSFALQNSTLKITKASDSLAPVQAEWDVQLDCHQTDIQAGVELRNINGSVRLVGASDGTQCREAGELDIDSATFQGVQLTEIRGPIWIDETSCRLGHWASAAQGQASRRISARLYDGYLVGDAWVTYDGLPQYGAEGSITGADLERIMTERFPGGQDFRGKVAANFSVRGRGRQVENMEGEGDVKVTDAEIYQLPLLVGLLKVLRNSTPDSTAFNQADMKFRIQGRHIYLDQLDFLGDAVSFYGKGYTNFDQQLNLAFYGVVGRNEIRVPVLKDFVSQIGQSTMQMYVDGSLADPQIHTQAFPMVNQLIQQIQTDLDAAGAREAQRGSSTSPR